MKKSIICIICISLSFYMLCFSYADTIDISGLSREELHELYEEIQKELYSQSLVDGISIPQGTYVSEKDIPAGMYIISAKGKSPYVSVHVYDSDGNMIYIQNLTENGASIKVDIREVGASFSVRNNREGVETIIQVFSSLFGNK